MPRRTWAHLSCMGCFLLPWGAAIAVAQEVVPDGTLPTQVQLDPTTQGFVVQGGAPSGTNLFHSFEKFSPGARPVLFDLQVGGFEAIKHIFSRVTGTEASYIDGLLQTLGGSTPDLFLLNPHGVVFGPNARLDLGGSFIGTTAEAILFGDGFRFATRASPTDSLLSLSMPVGLQLGENAGTLALAGPGHEISVPQITDLPTLLEASSEDYNKGLHLAPGNTLALIGNGIRIEGGTLQAQIPQGGVQFSLGSGKDGVVNIQPSPQWSWSFGYENLKSSSDIWLGQQTRIDGSGVLPSRIHVSGRNITLAEGTAVYSQNFGSFPNEAIIFQADEQLTITGSTDPQKIPSSIRSSSLSQGNGGAIEIQAGDLLLWEGGNIATTSFLESGNSGDIKLNVDNDIRLTGFLQPQNDSPFLTFIVSTAWAQGDGGLIDINTNNLVVENGALISSSSLFSTGNSNDVNIIAAESVLVEGFNPANQFVSGIASSSFASGDAGSINIVTPRLSLLDGGFISASIYEDGNAGNINITASELVEIENRTVIMIDGFPLYSGISSNAVNSQSPFLRRLFDIVGEPTGQSGSVIIQTPKFQLSNNGNINVTNEGSGDAGELKITAKMLSLDQSTLTASTVEGNGGNISLEAVDTLTLRNGSTISASAGGQGNGGNIDIAAKKVIAKPSENSDITANAVGNAGGMVTLDTSALLGLEVRPQLTDLSDITASSELGSQFSGTVELVQPNAAPDSALTVLPDSQLKPVDRLAQGCSVGEAKFHIMGRGGLARSPLDLPELGLFETGLIAQKSLQGKEVKQLEQLSLQVSEAIALRDRGFYPNALAQLEAVYQVKALAALPDLQSQVMRQLGITHRLLGHAEEARAALEESLAIAQGSPQATAATLLSLGHLAKTQGKSLQARQQYLQALAVGLGSDVESLVLASLMALEIEQQDWSAIEQWRQQLKTQVGAPSQAVITGRLHGLAVQLKALQTTKQSSSAEREHLRNELQMLLTLAQQQNEPVAVAYGLGYLGQIEELSGNWGLAQQYTERALQLAQASTDQLMAYQWSWQLGRIARDRWKQTGDEAWYNQSQGSYRLALESLKSLRSDLLTVAPELQLSFRSEIEPVYREYVDLLLTQSASGTSTVPPERLQEAMKTVEALRLAELDNYLQDACLTARPRSVAEIDGDAAVIYPIVLGDRLEVIVSLPQGKMRRYSQPVSQAELAQTVTAFRDGLVWRSQRDFNEPSQQLYQWLIQPALEELQAEVVETVVFVPDGVLKNVPLAAVSDGQEYLIEKFAVATVPSIELLPSQGEVNNKAQTLAAGITQMRQGLAPLPYVIQELSDIQTAIPGQKLLDEQFTRQMLADVLLKNDASIVHIATHGQFSSQASETFVQAWDEQISLTQLGDILQGRARQGLSPTELLVLSACETAVGDEAAALGLAGVAVRAGARSTLASLWSVNDQSTAALMGEFYQQLAKPGMGKSQALRQTQLAMLQDPVYNHPYYWSAFVLLGDWQ